MSGDGGGDRERNWPWQGLVSSKAVCTPPEHHHLATPHHISTITLFMGAAERSRCGPPANCAQPRRTAKLVRLPLPCPFALPSTLPSSLFLLPSLCLSSSFPAPFPFYHPAYIG